jgi:hypothetical protein
MEHRTPGRRRSPEPLRIALVLAACAPLLAAPGAAGAARRCEDPSGRVLFTDQECPPGTRLVKELEQPIQKVTPSSESPARQPERAADVSDAAVHPRPSGPPPADPVPRAARGVLGARFARARGDLSSLKLYSSGHRAETGEWPRGPEDVGLDPKSFDTLDIVEVGYRPDGGIVGYLDPVFGHGRWIWLQPRSALGGAGITWACVTNVEQETLPPGAYGDCEPAETPPEAEAAPE